MYKCYYTGNKDDTVHCINQRQTGQKDYRGEDIGGSMFMPPNTPTVSLFLEVEWVIGGGRERERGNPKGAPN